MDLSEVRETRETTKEERAAALRMWLFVRRDLPMPPGKLAAQAGHGFSTCLYRTTLSAPDVARRYMEEAQAKVAVAVRDEAALRQAVARCAEAGLVATIVEDAGHTVFGERTVTVGAVGPCLAAELPKSVARLRLFTEFDACDEIRGGAAVERGEGAQ